MPAIPKIWLLNILVVLCCNGLVAQPHLIRHKLLGDKKSEAIYDGIRTMDSGWLLIGATNSTGGMVQCTNTSVTGHTWLMKLDSAWAIEWQQCYPQDRGAVSRFIERHTDGSYVIFGQSLEDTSLLPCQYGSSDLWLMHIDSMGQVLGQRCYGGSGIEHLFAFELTSRNTYLVAARSSSSDGDLYPHYASGLVEDAWAFELDSQFNFIWSFQWGGTGYDQANAIAEHPQGGYLVAANSSSYNGDVTANTGTTDPWLLRLDTAGQLLWQKHYGKATHEDNLHMLLDSQGHIYLAMETNALPGQVKGNSDIRLLKLDLQGNVIRDTYIGGNKSEYINDFKWMDGNLLIAGRSTSTGDGVPGNYGDEDIWLAIVDTQLQVLRSNHYGGSDMDRIYSLHCFDKYVYGFGQTRSGDHDFSGNQFANGLSQGFITEWITFPVGFEDIKPYQWPITVFPNPSQGEVQIKLGNGFNSNGHPPVRYEVYDSTGRLAVVGELKEEHSKISLQGLPNGIYFLRLVSVDSLSEATFIILHP